MNANPMINVALAARRSKVARQRVMRQMAMRRGNQAPGAVGRGAAGSSGGRTIFGGQPSKLPLPHLTRQSRLAPALVAALGIGAAGIPDAAVGGIANGAQNNVAEQAQGIPDWAPDQLDETQDMGTDAPPFSGPIYTGAGGPGGPGPNGGYGADASRPLVPTAAEAAAEAAGQANLGGNGGLIHLGNGVFFDPASGSLRSGGRNVAF